MRDNIAQGGEAEWLRPLVFFNQLRLLFVCRVIAFRKQNAVHDPDVGEIPLSVRFRAAEQIIVCAVRPCVSGNDLLRQRAAKDGKTGDAPKTPAAPRKTGLSVP